MKVGNHHCQPNHLYLLEKHIYLRLQVLLFFQYIGDKKKMTATHTLFLTVGQK